ncbi:MAG: hypothetical protein M3376_14180, partial [Actinomycetota bacterium]|nr:hypothetical protein [Actinomycetota bacterium]
MTGRRVAWGPAIVCLALAVPAVVLLALGARESTPSDEFGLAGVGGLSFLAAFLVFASVGGLIVSRAPGNAIGPIFCAIGLIGTVGTFAYQYADYAIAVAPGALPGGAIAAWVQNLLPPVFGLLALSLLLFPDGRLMSRRWRPVVGLASLGVVCIVIGYALRPGPIEFPFEAVSNPFGVPGLQGPMDAAIGIGWLAMVSSAGLAGLAITLRLRRSRGLQRQQLKWAAFAGVLAGGVLVANGVTFDLEVAWIDRLRIVVVGLAFAGLPVAAGIAILRYRLYDIDVVINRTLVYGALTASLAAVYLGSVLLLQLLLSGVTQGSGLAVAASTLAVAALFRPARERIQTTVDRRFYRSKYDAARTLERFVAHLRDEVDLDALAGELRAV